MLKRQVQHCTAQGTILDICSQLLQVASLQVSSRLAQAVDGTLNACDVPVLVGPSGDGVVGLSGLLSFQPLPSVGLGLLDQLVVLLILIRHQRMGCKRAQLAVMFVALAPPEEGCESWYREHGVCICRQRGRRKPWSGDLTCSGQQQRQQAESDCPAVGCVARSLIAGRLAPC